MFLRQEFVLQDSLDLNVCDCAPFVCCQRKSLYFTYCIKDAISETILETNALSLIIKYIPFPTFSRFFNSNIIFYMVYAK